ncbi:MAG TPA: pyruvate formate-lyase [Erysipelotrichaceae bacterium]|nr:pyruvate formate-lyase [Erysipelotrichaceae bacterium]
MNYITKESYDRLLKRDYRKLRRDIKIDVSSIVGNRDISLPLRVSRRLMKMVEHEKAIVYENERIGFYRTIRHIPSILSDEEIKEIEKTQCIFDNALVCNISSDYEYTLNVGFNKRLEEIKEKLEENNTAKENDELLAMQESIYATYKIVQKYHDEALNVGNVKLARILENVPYNRPNSYHEALVFFRIMNYMLWINANKHNTIGRFDQYMYPFFKKDIDEGVLNYEEALDLTEELFISLNFDADLYPGVQQGDNGQSLVLGGVKPNDGSDAYNELSKLCLEASLTVNLIDPKINMRVNKNTDMKWYELGTKLTKKGLGFPQYSNDDVVIPALLKLGYSLEDARDYVMAACWEFIIPKVGMDIPNVDALSFPELVDRAIHSESFMDAQTYEEVEEIVNKEMEKEVLRLTNVYHSCFLIPSPFQSILMKDCVNNKKDIADGGKYNNYGFHGAGIANASDSLAAIKEHIFEKKDIAKEELLTAIDNNFEGYLSLQKKLISSPKMGNNEAYVDDIAVRLLDKFSLECSKYKNAKGGCYRAGTGTAMYYIWYSEKLGATADGRKNGEPFAANYSPSLNVNFNGVLSVISSFTKPNLQNVCNGGPLTLEFHDTVFRNEDGEKKVAMLVKTYIALGGHQLQLNAINRDVLLDAQKHPEDHKNLIVRVWGWSGYFNELDLVYQNHIIKRLEFNS